MDHRLITPYHPQANGVAERYVQTAKRTIVKMSEGNGTDWDIHLPTVQYAMNMKVTARHGSTPFSLMFGRTPNGFHDFRGTTDTSQQFDGEGYRKRLQELTETLYPAINEKIQAYNKARIEQVTKERSFPNGAYVMAINHTRGNKFEAAYEGPFKVLHRNKGGAYLLQDTDGNTMHRNFTPSELKLVSHEPDDTNTSYQVEKILDHTGKPGSYKYLVKWKGYKKSESTWEPVENFDDINIIAKYWKDYRSRQPDKPEKIPQTNPTQQPTEKSTPKKAKKDTRPIEKPPQRASLPRAAKRKQT
jgi:hypothetical protein